MPEKIGIVGGIGWPGTALYYAGLCKGAAARGDVSSPPMTIESLDMSQTMACRGTDDADESWADFDRLFIDAIGRLEQAGCRHAAIASATPHTRLNAISNGATLPLISILDAVAEDMNGVPPSPVIVLGTAITMSSALFDPAVSSAGHRPICLPEHAQAAFCTLLDDYFYPGRAEAGRAALVRFLRTMVQPPPDCIILLGCTDLSPSFPEAAATPFFDTDGYRFLDTTACHVRAILRGSGWA